MAEADNTLAGLVQMNDQNLADLDVSDLLQDAPLLSVLYAQSASNGTLHKYTKETVAAGAGFRALNAGIANAAPQEELVTDTLKLLDASFSRDKGLAMGYGKGKDAYMAKEMMKSVRASFFALESQILAGTNANASGFNGLADDMADLNDAFVVDATGASAGTGSSCYLVREGMDAVSVIMGNDGNLDVGEIYETEKLDGSSNPYTALAIAILGWGGLQVGSIYDAARIANLTAETGKGLTDDLIASAISKFKAGRQPSYIVCNRRSLMQLQKSRTATSTTGAPAPFPIEAFNIPIISTDGIGNTETLLTT
jgi:hypothetical protein